MSVSAASPAPGNGWSAKALIATSAGISSLCASLLSVGTAAVLWNYQTHRTERAAETTKFIAAAQQFDRAVSNFMSPYLRGEDTSKERDQLHANIQDQYLALESAVSVLSGDDAREARLYSDKIVAVGEQLDREIPAAEAQSFMQSVADARDVGICVTFRLRLANGMDVSNEDKAYCAQHKG